MAWWSAEMSEVCPSPSISLGPFSCPFDSVFNRAPGMNSFNKWVRLPIRSAQRNHLMHFASIVYKLAHANIINRYNLVFSVYWWRFKSVLSWTRVSVKIWSLCKCCRSHWKIDLIIKRRISFWQLLLTMYCWHVWNSAITILNKSFVTNPLAIKNWPGDRTKCTCKYNELTLT